MLRLLIIVPIVFALRLAAFAMEPIVLVWQYVVFWSLILVRPKRLKTIKITYPLFQKVVREKMAWYRDQCAIIFDEV